MRRARIEVPATSANLGPGFDSLGLALDITDTVRVEIDPGGRDVMLADTSGDDLESLNPHDNLLCRAYRAWAEDTGSNLPGARFAVESRIPIARGLGSSAAAIVAGLAAAAFAAGEKSPRERMLRLACCLEGHPDNAAAAVMGGMTVGFMDGPSAHALHVANHLTLGIALFIPREPLLTSDARGMLPSRVSLSNAVFNLGRVAYLVTALQWGRWDRIGPAMEDRLHQPARIRVLPALPDVIGAARAAGAYGAALSGGGPAVIALGPSGRAEEFAAAMERCATDRGWEGEAILTTVRERGVTLHEETVDKGKADEKEAG